MKKLAILLTMAAAALSAHAEIRTIVFCPDPAMRCPNCEAKVQKGLLEADKGVSKVKTCLEFQEIAVTYDDAVTTPDNIASILKGIGYKATPVEAPKCTGEVCTHARPDSCPGDEKGECDDK